MAAIKIDRFLGMIPKTPERRLPENNSVLAKHCDLRRGLLSPLKAVKSIASYTGPALKSIYWYVPIGQADHNIGALLGTTSVANMVVSPAADDKFKRIYITNDDPLIKPLITADTLIPATQNIDLGTVAPMGLNENPWGVGQVTAYDLAIPAPLTAPAAAVVPVPVGDALSITMTDPVVVEVGQAGSPVAHGLVTGDRVEITGSASVPALNGIWSITVVSETEIELDGSLGTTWTGTYVASQASGKRYWDAAEEDSRTYVFTYVSSVGEETAPSLASTVIDVGPRQSVDLTGITDCPLYAAGNHRWDGPAQTPAYAAYVKRIYRSVAGELHFLADLSHGTTIYTDSIEALVVGKAEVLPSEDYDTPPDDLHSLCLHPGSFLVGISGSDLCFSEAGQPHAWPLKYRLKMDYKGVALGVYGTSIACLTEGYPEVATGTHPSNIVKEKVELAQSCTSKRSAVDAGYTIVYSSPDGLVVIGIGATGIASTALHTKAQWAAVNPASLRSAYYDDKYYCFFDSAAISATGHGGFMVDLKKQADGITYTDQQVDCAFYDAVSDNLFLSAGGNAIVLLEKGATAMAYDWRSKKYLIPRYVNFGAAVVHAETYAALTFEMWAVDSTGAWVLIHSQTVTSDQPFRLPGGMLYQEVQIRFSGTDTVKMAAVAETMSELRSL